MDKPMSNETDVAILHNPNREDDSPASQEVRSIFNPGETNILDIPILTSGLHQRQPSPCKRPRTSVDPNITLPDLPNTNEGIEGIPIHNISHEHIIKESTSANIRDDDRCPTNKSPDPNSSRHLSSILKFLHVNFEGVTESHSTLQLVKYFTRFISYLVRKGLGSFYKYGCRIIPILRPLTDALLHYDTTDLPSTSSLACDQYIEQKKQASKETITQRTFSIDYISNLILDNKITSYEAFQRILPTETKIQLLKQLGYVGQNIIKTLIKIHTIEALQNIKTKHYYQLILDSFDISLVQENNVSWLTRLFSSNGISIDNFFAKLLIIHSTNITKINTFVLQGPTNTSKSLLLNLILSDTKPTRIARERDKSNFHLDQLPNSTAVLFEEPIIDHTTIGTWKLLLEGSPIPTDMKHSDKEIINRLPVFISTNQPIWNWVSADDVSPLKQRLFQFDLTTQIASFVDKSGTIPQPPSIITKHDLYATHLRNLQAIFQLVGRQTSTTTNQTTLAGFIRPCFKN
jgi:hypothetical protein